MSFAADAARSQQWMYPGLLYSYPSVARSGLGGYATGAPPLISTPSSAAFSSSSAATGPSRPLTPDGLITRNQRSKGAKEETQIPEKKPSAAPALPPVYRLSSWPDFSENDILGGGADPHDDLLAAASDRFGDSLIITTAGLDDKFDPFTELEKSSDTPASEDAKFFSSPPSEASDETTPETATPDDADSKTSSMTGPSYMAVTTRPLTAREYQRYRSQRRSEVPSRPTRSASSRHQPKMLHDSRPRSGSEGCFGGLGAASGIVAGETAAMKALGEKIVHRKPGPSPACTTREEFEALPPAIQRKYFSTVERLRLTQPPNVTIDSSQANNDFYDFSSTPLKLRKSRRSLAAPDLNPNQPRPRPTHHPRTLSVDSALQTQSSGIPQGRRPGPHLDRAAARNKILSVIVDATDEPSSKAEAPTRTATPNEEGDFRSSVPSSPTAANMDASRSSTAGKERQSAVPDSFFESFRFMEEADDLDLRLQLDSFDEIPEEPEQTTAKRAKHRHPSFRRNFSISKINLNRSSQPPPSRPETKARTATPTSPPPSLSSPVSPVSSNHGRRRSRAFSLRAGQASIAEGISAPATSSAAPIDPDAAHYQDPDARLKLRVYLASPQKFDEAVEFGFPSAEMAPHKRKHEPHPLRKQQSCADLPDDQGERKQEDDAADDKSSVYSDEGSVAEPDSPKTPEPLEKPPARPFRAVSDVGTVKPNRHHGYSGSHASSREMTLRMTLTRPDLRACEDQIYGWQQKGAAQKAQSPVPADEARRSPSVMYVREGSTKDSIERQFAAMDAWPEPEKGVVKRFWNKVRRS